MGNSTEEPFTLGQPDEYRGWQLKAVAISFMVLDCVFVLLRFYSRYVQRRRLKADDWLMVPALLFSIGVIVTAFIAVDHGGVGYHVQYVITNHVQFRIWYQTSMIAVCVLYLFAAAFPKLAILSLYLQIFVDKWSRVGTWATIAAICINVIVMTPVLIYKCDPISYGWNHWLEGKTAEGWCASIEPRLQYASLANIVTDLAMFFLPIPTLRRLQTNKITKIGLFLTFGMALAGLITSCLRFGAFFATDAYKDGTWASTTLVSWCIVEPGIYIFVASQMAFRPLAKAFRRSGYGSKFFGTLSRPVSRYKSRGKSGVPNEEKSILPPRPQDLVPHSMHQTNIGLDSQADSMPSAPPSVYNGNIWIRHEYQVENLPSTDPES